MADERNRVRGRFSCRAGQESVVLSVACAIETVDPPPHQVMVLARAISSHLQIDWSQSIRLRLPISIYTFLACLPADLNTTPWHYSMKRLSINRPLYSSIHFTQSHSPLKFSFHKLTLLSPPLTARTLPLRLQLTLHSTASKFRTIDFQSFGCAGSEVHIRTVLSWDADAM